MGNDVDIGLPFAKAQSPMEQHNDALNNCEGIRSAESVLNNLWQAF
jgi:hypothetical protein